MAIKTLSIPHHKEKLKLDSNYDDLLEQFHNRSHKHSATIPRQRSKAKHIKMIGIGKPLESRYFTMSEKKGQNIDIKDEEKEENEKKI